MILVTNVGTAKRVKKCRFDFDNIKRHQQMLYLTCFAGTRLGVNVQLVWHCGKHTIVSYHVYLETRQLILLLQLIFYKTK